MLYRRVKLLILPLLVIILSCMCVWTISCSDEENRQAKVYALQCMLTNKEYDKLLSYAPTKNDAYKAAETLGPSSYYFLALHYRAAQQDEIACALLKRGIKKSPAYFADLCQQELASYKVESLETPVTQDDFITQWYTTPTLFVSHTEDFFKWSMSLSEEEKDISVDFMIAALRVAVFQQRYTQAFAYAQKILGTDVQKLSVYVFSDIGKAYLYGSSSFLTHAVLFNSLTTQVQSDDCRFMLFFYAGRFYGKAENLTEALTQYQNAYMIAPTDVYYDTALWYYLTTLHKKTPEKSGEAFKTLASTWHDASYFNDYIETISVYLLTNRLWNELYELRPIVVAYADADKQAQWNYISARLVQEEYVFVPYPHTVAQELFQKAFDSDHSVLYYRFLSAAQLHIPIEEVESTLYRRKINTAQIDANFEMLLNAYADFGFPELVYPLASERIEALSVAKASELTQKLNADHIALYPQALRLIASALREVDVAITREHLELLYPRHFYPLVAEASARFALSEYVLYGLIRSESFFEADVVSWAGAIGLTQLMKPTAGDVARKLKITDYDLNDPKTNITFGAFYLAELISRLDNQPLLALFSYNGGITRVRNWRKAVNDVPLDLFLETVPFPETQEYGRKVLSAAALYGYLYYGKTPEDVVKELFQ